MLVENGIANGYLNKKEVTSKSFVQNPFGEGYLYRTGDLGKYRKNGDIDYIDRTDNQIKIRGLRIELGEIESVILKYPNINKAIVLKQSINDRDFLTSYFVANKKIAITELRKHISKYLPKYMVPSYYICLDDFPYTANGKIDKKSLPLPTEVLSISQENYIAPRTDLQKKLVTIWENILNTKPIGINDNFFELGGDSLLAMNLNIELLEITDKISYSDIFHFPTIAELEEKINSDKNELLFDKIGNLSDSYTDILNNCTKREKIKQYHPKNILLTGSTGFLGIHILDEYIKNENGNFFCIVRSAPGVTARKKLHQKLNYYFGNKYDNLIDKRIFAITGDTTKPGFGLNQEDLLSLSNSIDIVINSAALVSHYGNYENFYNSNVKSTKLIIDFCKSFNKKLYHISTTGVSGEKLDLEYLRSLKKNTSVNFDETKLYVGQILDNVYVRSKFEAENAILEAIADGLDAYILRMGNLMPRYNDGVFQENIMDNAFITKLASFVKIGIMPNYMLENMLNFTPVDYAAKAIYKISTNYTNKNRVFHLYNNKDITVKRYLRSLKKQKTEIRILEEKEFIDNINLILKDDSQKNSLNNIINDFDNKLHINYTSDIITISKFTNQYLRRIHFKWPRISNKYLEKFNNVLRRII